MIRSHIERKWRTIVVKTQQQREITSWDSDRNMKKETNEVYDYKKKKKGKHGGHSKKGKKKDLKSAGARNTESNTANRWF